MSSIKKDVNIGLLILIVATLIMFSAFTVYYQTTFKNISKSYKTKLDELVKVTSDLDLKRTLLNETSTQLDLKKQREEDFNVKFTEVRGERDTLESDKNQLTVDLTSTKAQLAQSQSDLANSQAQVAEKQSELTDAYNSIQSLQKSNSNLKGDVDRLDTRVSCLLNTADGEEGNC
tara:strand:+ start:10889 stop:11413 length:525 start_codon:yes stop_codon:yes gene_type:complete